MKTTLRTKLLQHFAKKKNQNGGFTLIELLVVVIIIGILAAIALPAFLNQGNKAREASAKTAVSATNRAQQVYYLENSDFADTYAELGSTPDAQDYTFPEPTTTDTSATTTATSETGLTDYTGSVTINATTGASNATVTP